MPGVYKNLNGPSPLRNNVGGTVQYFLWAAISEFATIASVKDLSDVTVTDAKQYVEISADHTFLTGKGFKKVYITRDTGMAKIVPTGDRDGRSFKGTFEGQYPDINSDVLGQMTMMKNDRLIMLAVLADKTVLQLGSADFPAEVKPESDSAKNESGLRHSKWSFEAFLPQPQFYTGAIVLAA